jgi:hypothetical protein
MQGHTVGKTVLTLQDHILRSRILDNVDATANAQTACLSPRRTENGDEKLVEGEQAAQGEGENGSVQGGNEESLVAGGDEGGSGGEEEDTRTNVTTGTDTETGYGSSRRDSV